LMLEHVGHRSAAARIERAVMRTLENGVGLTPDLGGEGTTASITEQLIKNLGA
jgi:isocitrate dehydrogenase (NAD+)